MPDRSPSFAAADGADIAGPRIMHETPLVLGAAMAVGTVALMVLGVQPILLGGLIQEGRIAEAGLGQVAMAEVLCLALGTCVGPVVMNRGSMRIKVVAASGLLALANLLTCRAASLIPLLLARSAAGLLEGLALGAAVVVMTYTRHPDRISGLFLGLQTIPQMVAALIFPTVLIPRYGVNSCFLALAASSLLSAAGGMLLVDRVTVAPREGAVTTRWNSAVILLVGAIILQNAGIGAAWNYSERLAAQHGFDGTVVGLSTSASLVCQVFGALMVAWIGWRLPHRQALILGCLVQAAIVIALLATTTPATYMAAASMFGLFWLALQPYQVNYAIEVDESRAIAVLLTPIALVGLSIGPLIVSFAVGPHGVDGAYIAACVLLLLAALSYLAARLGRPAGQVRSGINK